jgi:hypothetical protein
MPRGNPDKLIPQNRRTKQEQSEIARKGGIKSGKVRHEKKLMSQIYADFLIKEHDVIGKDGLIKKLSGQALVNGVMSKVLSRGDGSSVSMLREVREGTEGSKVKHEGLPDKIEIILPEILKKPDES